MKFTLYFLIEYGKCKAIFSGDELDQCLNYINANNLPYNRCMVLSPNSRRITFTDNGDLIIGDMPSSSVA